MHPALKSLYMLDDILSDFDTSGDKYKHWLNSTVAIFDSVYEDCFEVLHVFVCYE